MGGQANDGNRDGKRKHQGDSSNSTAKSQKTKAQLDAQTQLSRPAYSTQATAGSSSSAARTARPGYQSVYNPNHLSQPGVQLHPGRERDAWLAEEIDINEIVGSSQDDAEGSDQLHLYGTLATKIVGVQYYRGFANAREQILIRREPGNPYDSNAIRIDNVAAIQIGHIPRTVASKIAKYIDNKWLHMEGQLAGEKGSFDCPLSVHMYGPSPDSQEGRVIQEKMLADKLPMRGLQEAEKRRKGEEKERLAAARQAASVGSQARAKFANQASSVGTGGPSNIADILEASQRINPREIGKAADTHGISEEQLINMPMADAPAGIHTTMLPYQLQALQWLLNQERPQLPSQRGQSVQLWTKSVQGFTNLATNTTQANPQLASGGILADDMGLGKTLEMISLLVVDAEKYGKGTTLIVAPLSVMSNWTGQIATHVKETHKMETYTYHGSGRRSEMNQTDFSKYDVVLTTYQTLASDYMPTKSSKLPNRELGAKGLYSMEWRRVILDEGHQIRNPRAKSTAAVNALMAKSRWVLTGTPIVNSLKDLYSLLRFIGVTGGLAELDIFNRVLIRPLKDGVVSATLLLQGIMAAFTLRRRKEMAYIDLKLPKLEEFVHRIEFTVKERERYEALDAEAKGLLKKYEKKSNAGKGSGDAYQHLLEILLRMRQCCNHWQLCGERITRLLEQLGDSKAVALTPENTKALQAILQLRIESQEECPICLEVLHNPVITNCGHTFGFSCISHTIELQKKCPMCRNELADETSLVQPANECGEESAEDSLETTQSSSKLEALIKILDATKASGNKTIVFSQWTRFLNIVQSRLETEGHKFCRLDGTMSAAKRDEALRALEEDAGTTVMLASLGVCAVGLNLTAANNVILSDTWWAPAIEDQAVDRVHRLGQKKETKVFRLVMDDSIEESTIEVQRDKRKLMMVAFSEKASKREGARNGRLADIQRLLA